MGDKPDLTGPFARHNCPGPDACEKIRPRGFESSKLSACATCKVPKQFFVGGAKVYRSYADYCDD